MVEWFQYSDEVSEINRCKEKIAKEKEKIADSEFNIRLYTNHMVSKMQIMFSIIPEDTLRLVWNNINKDEKEEKFNIHYKYINDVIKDHIIGDTECDYKKTKLITEMYCEGYSSYGYSIHFIADKIEFTFTVPVPKHINSENYIYANDGMYRLGYKETECCDTYLACSYNLKDLHKAFKEFIENEARKKKGEIYINKKEIL